MDLVLALKLSLVCLATFFICGIPFGLYFGRHFAHVDVRDLGSGNIGATNVARTVGAKAGAATFLADGLKGFLCVLAACYLLPYDLVSWVYVFAVAGHIFSPYLSFKGGKGVSVGFGCALAFMPWVAVEVLTVFLVAVLITKRVSVASLSAAVSLPIAAWLIYQPSMAAIAPLCVVSIMVIWAHRSNISRLIHGEENDFSFKNRS